MAPFTGRKQVQYRVKNLSKSKKYFKVKLLESQTCHTM